MNPKVTVLMSVYNGMPYLPDSVKSVLNQTYANFELLIIEDGSTDDSLKYLKELKDQRVRIEINQTNLGMAASLNRGLLLAQGKYIARLDADDISLPERIQQQINYLENNQEMELCGSYAQAISETGEALYVWKQVSSPLEIGWKILFKNPFIHSSVMFRRDTVLRRSITYHDLSGAEDYQFWSDILRFGDGANLDQVLIQYRRHDKSMTTYNFIPMKEAHFVIANRNQASLLEAEVSKTESYKLISEYNKGQVSFRSANLYCKLLRKYLKNLNNTSGVESFVKAQKEKLMSRLHTKPLKLYFSIRCFFRQYF